MRIHLSGPIACGKSTVARLIVRTLKEHGYTNVHVAESVGPGPPEAMLNGLPTEILITEGQR